MARGQSQAAEAQLGTTNQIGAQAGQQAGQIHNKLIPGYESLMDPGYLNQADKNAATVNEMGAATQPFESAKFDANNRAAATRNPAGVAEQQDQLAQEEGRTAGTAAGALQQQQMQNQEAGMYGLGNIGQEQTGLEESMYGLGPGTLQARAAGSSPWASGLAGVLSGGANLISAFKGGK